MASENSQTQPIVDEKTAHDPARSQSLLSDRPQADGAAALERVTSHAEDYPHGLKLTSVLLSIYLSVFLIALDRTIIATALPRITDEFNSFGDIGWVRLVLPSSTPRHLANVIDSTMLASCCPRRLFNYSLVGYTHSTRQSGSS